MLAPLLDTPNTIRLYTAGLRSEREVAERADLGFVSSTVTEDLELVGGVPFRMGGEYFPAIHGHTVASPGRLERCHEALCAELRVPDPTQTQPAKLFPAGTQKHELRCEEAAGTGGKGACEVLPQVVPPE